MSNPVRGLLTPFQRDQRRDVASGTGPALLESKVVQVLATERPSKADPASTNPSVPSSASRCDGKISSASPPSEAIHVARGPAPPPPGPAARRSDARTTFERSMTPASRRSPCSSYPARPRSLQTTGARSTRSSN
jgi:hypothetical protein